MKWIGYAFVIGLVIAILSIAYQTFSAEQRCLDRGLRLNSDMTCQENPGRTPESP